MSAASRAPGKQRASGDEGVAAGSEPVEVTLEHSRWRHFGWVAFGLALGLLLVIKLSTVGKMIGLVLVAIAAYHAYLFVRTLMSPPGTIKVTDEKVDLPVGLCRGEFQTFAVQDVRHAFLLRHAVSWTTTAPVLVIEAGERVFTYPRDWFLSETDQRRIARAIHARQGKLSGA